MVLDLWESPAPRATPGCARGGERGASGLWQEGVWAQACFLEDVLTQARSSRASCPRRVPVFPIDIPETWPSQAVTGLTSSSGSRGWRQPCIQMPSARQLDAGGRGVLTRGVLASVRLAWGQLGCSLGCKGNTCLLGNLKRRSKPAMGELRVWTKSTHCSCLPPPSLLTASSRLSPESLPFPSFTFFPHLLYPR